MKITVRELKRVIRETLAEARKPKGKDKGKKNRNSRCRSQ